MGALGKMLSGGGGPSPGEVQSKKFSNINKYLMLFQHISLNNMLIMLSVNN